MGMLTILFGYVVVLMSCWFECECDEEELVEREEQLLVCGGGEGVGGDFWGELKFGRDMMCGRRKRHGFLGDRKGRSGVMCFYCVEG